MFVSVGLVGIGAEGVWPVFQIRLLLVIVGVEFATYAHGWQRALAVAAARLRRMSEDDGSRGEVQ